MTTDRKVFIPNKSFHDFSAASQFGELIYLTEGMVRRNNINQIYREISDGMASATAEDYILISSLGVLNAVAASIMAWKFGRVNFLVWNGERYSPREIVLDGMIPKAA